MTAKKIPATNWESPRLIDLEERQLCLLSKMLNVQIAFQVVDLVLLIGVMFVLWTQHQLLEVLLTTLVKK